MRNTQRAIFALVMLLAMRGSVFAQSGWFVEGRVLADNDRTLVMRSATTLGGGAAVGVLLTRAVSVRSEFDIPAWHVDETVYRASTVFGPTEIINQHTAARTLTWSFLVARHTKTLGRFQAALLAGFALTSRPWTESSRLDTLDAGGGIAFSRFAKWSSDHWWFAIPVGVDVSVQVARRLAIVPQLRIYVYPFPTDTPAQTILRPAITLRWTFGQ